MNPVEQQKADAWMLLQDSDVVKNRIMKVMQDTFNNPEVMRWMVTKMIDAETRSMATPLKAYFEDHLRRNLRLILADGVGKEVSQLMQPMLEETVARHVGQVSKDLAELKKLKSKGPVGRR